MKANEFWAARDKAGYLFLFKSKPHINKQYLLWEESPYQDIECEGYRTEIELPQGCLPEITFANSPKRVRIEIV